MNKVRSAAIAAVGMAVLGTYLGAQQPQAPAGQGQGGGGRQGPPPMPMSFFVTSVPKGDGANYGGLAGADAYCQQLATAAGRGAATWRAYLSTQGPGAISARDRIGAGPWYNARGQLIAMNVAELHGDTIEQARLGNRLGKQLSRSEKQELVNGVGDMPNQHDILTGSQPDGRAYADATPDRTCSNWTSSQHVEAPARGAGGGGGGGAAAGGAPAQAPPPGPSAQLGHHDKQGGGNGSWNSAHGSRGCSQMNLVATGGAGLLYCFATN